MLIFYTSATTLIFVAFILCSIGKIDSGRLTCSLLYFSAFCFSLAEVLERI